MRIVTRFLSAVAVLLLLCSVSEARNLKGVFNLGIDIGGDELAYVTFVGGGTDDIKAGELLSLAGGLMYTTKSLDTMFTIGYKFDNSSAENGNIDWYRFPVDFVMLYKIKRFRVGGGLTYHINPTLKGDGVASGINANFDDALGYLVQSDFIVYDSMTVGLRYTIIDYDVENSSVSVDGNSVGLIFGVAF